MLVMRQRKAKQGVSPQRVLGTERGNPRAMEKYERGARGAVAGFERGARGTVAGFERGARGAVAGFEKGVHKVGRPVNTTTRDVLDLSDGVLTGLGFSFRSHSSF